MNIVIPMAGPGSRFRDEGYNDPKPLINVLGKPMIQAAIESLGMFGNYIFIIKKNNELNDNNIKKLLRKIKPGCLIHEVDYLTEGPAATCMLVSKIINSDEPLVITNCDQIMEWDPSFFLEAVSQSDCDAGVVTYNSKTEKNSYVRVGPDGAAIEFAEKKVISNFSLNGIHYWKKGSDFVNSAQKMIEKDIRVNNEFYIAPTYNEMIKEKKRIIIHHISEGQHHAVGTPEDLKKYEDLQTKRNA